jgi:nicotinamidase/pyrazinamidase
VTACWRDLWDYVAADGALPVDGAEAIVAPMQAWLARLQQEDVEGVLFTFDTHVPAIYAESEEAKQFPPHCVKGSGGWELVVDPGAVDPTIPVYALEKGVFDMWAEPGPLVQRIGGTACEREMFFAGLRGDGVREVIVVGVAADYCVRWAVEGLIERGFRVITPPPAFTREIARQIETVAADEWPDAVVRIAESV